MKKKLQIIKLDEDISFEEAMRHLANTTAEDVDEAMQESNSEPEIECPPDEQEYPVQ